MVIITLAPFNDAKAELEFRSNPKLSTPIPSFELSSESSPPIDKPIFKTSINSTSKGIQLHFQDYPLGEILKNIHNETGIRFNISSEMEKNLISLDIEAKYWKNLVQKLIEGYSRIEVWTNQPKTSEIWLVKSNPYN